MRHNKIIGWDNFLEVVERVQKVSPWLSRQIAKRASEWPFFYSGVKIVEWGDQQAWVQMSLSFRNSIEGEICHGHLVLSGELALRLVLLRYRQEFPFRYRIVSSRLETHHAVDQTVDIKFAMAFSEWERIRLELARDSRSLAEFSFSAMLGDGRLAGSFTVQIAFELEKFLPT
jgi:hypothetical protein